MDTMKKNLSENFQDANGQQQPPLRMTGKSWGQLLLDIILFVVLFGGCISLFMGMLTLLFSGQENVQEISSGYVSALLDESFMLIAAMGAAWAVLAIRRQPFARLGISFKGYWKDFLTGAGIVCMLYAVSFSLSWAVGAVQVEGVSFSAEGLLLSFLFFLLVGLFEEIAMRGFVLGRMLDRGMNRFLALFLSSFLFSSFHFFNPDFSFLPFFNILLAGLFLGASFLYTRNLCFPIALHWFWNWVQGPVLGYKVSGISFGESLFQLGLPEKNLWNGGDFGFEGSLICTVMLVVGTLAIILHYERKSGFRYG